MNISNYTIRQARQEMKPLSLGYHGNIVDLWLVCNFLFVFSFNYFFNRERLVHEYNQSGELLVDLGSDQTSLHNPFGGGYYPVQLDFEEAQTVLKTDPVRFKDLVQERY